MSRHPCTLAINERTGRINTIDMGLLLAYRVYSENFNMVRLRVCVGVLDMAQIKASIPDELIEALDAAAVKLDRSRSELVRFAIETYLDELKDFDIAAERLSDPSDQILDWDEVKGGLHSTSKAQRP